MSDTELVRRLERLERMVRLQRLGLLFVGLLLAAGLVSGAVRQPQDSLDLKLLRIVDERGRVRASIGTLDDGVGFLKLYDQNGRGGITFLTGDKINMIGVDDDGDGLPRAAIGINEKGPFVRLFGRDGKEPLAALGVTDDGAGLKVADPRGRGSLHLVADEGKPRLEIRDEKEQSRCMMGIFEKGPALLLADDRPEPRAVMRLADGKPVIRLLDERGGDLARIPAEK